MKNKLQEGWKEVELGEVFEFQAKSKIQAGEGSSEGKYKFFTSSDIQSKFIDEANLDGEYLIFSTGGSAGVHYCNDKFSTSTDCFIVKVNDILFAKYVYYYIFTNIHLLEAGFKGAGLKHISKDYIRKLKIAFQEKKETQQKIVSVLEKAEQAKDMRKTADELTKDFLKAVFMEMFGNLNKNTKKWNIQNMEEFCPKDKNAIKAGPFGSSLKKECYVEEGYKIYGQEQVIADDFEYGDYYISEEKYRELENYKIQAGDILISLVGTYGKLSIVPTRFKSGIINPRLMKITLDKNKMNPLFFKYLFLSDYIKANLANVSHGGTMDIVNVGIVKQIKFPVPPLPLQNKFASIVKEVEEIKEQQKHSKEQIDKLFNALMQKAFKGELI